MVVVVRGTRLLVTPLNFPRQNVRAGATQEERGLRPVELPGQVGLRLEVMGWRLVRLRWRRGSSVARHEQRQLRHQRLHPADGGVSGRRQGRSRGQVGHFFWKYLRLQN